MASPWWGTINYDQNVLSLLNITPTENPMTLICLHRPDQTRPDQTRPDQTGTDQTRPDQTRPDQTRPDKSALEKLRCLSAGGAQKYMHQNILRHFRQKCFNGLIVQNWCTTTSTVSGALLKVLVQLSTTMSGFPQNSTWNSSLMLLSYSSSSISVTFLLPSWSNIKNFPFPFSLKYK